MKKFIKSLARPIAVPLMNSFGQRVSGPLKIRSYIRDLGPGQDLKVIFGGHWKNEEGWLILRERDEDITKRLSFNDESVSAIFTEHVVEHLPFKSSISFFIEAKRILKQGGVMRTVCPILEKMYDFEEKDPMVKSYVSAGLVPQFREEEKVLRSLGLGIQSSPKTFLFNNVFLRTGHSFIWSAELMKQVLEAIGFRSVEIKKVADGKYPLERTARGVAKEDEGTPYDPESLAVEAIK